MKSMSFPPSCACSISADLAVLEADHAAPARVGGEGAGVAVAGDHVGVLGDHPEAGTVGLVVVVHGRVVPQPREPLVGDALGEPVPVQEVDLAGVEGVGHVCSLEAGPVSDR